MNLIAGSILTGLCLLALVLGELSGGSSMRSASEPWQVSVDIAPGLLILIWASLFAGVMLMIGAFIDNWKSKASAKKTCSLKEKG